MPLTRYRFNSWKPLSVLPLAVGILGLTFTAGHLQSSNRVIAQERTLQTLTVTGRGVETIPTTMTHVRLGVEVQEKTAQQVQTEVARKSSAVVNLLRSRNVEKLETTGIRLNPTYSNSNNTRQIAGYLGSNIVSFRIDTEKAGNILDAAVSAGATRIDGISFVATDRAIAAAQKQALRLATQDAQEQADAVLAALNLTGREIISIQINGASTPVFESQARGIAQMADIATPLVGGEQQVTASVTLVVRY